MNKPLDYETWYNASERMPPKDSRIDLWRFDAEQPVRICMEELHHIGIKLTDEAKRRYRWRLVSLPDGWMLPCVKPEDSLRMCEVVFGPGKAPMHCHARALHEMQMQGVRIWRYATPLPEGL